MCSRYLWSVLIVVLGLGGCAAPRMAGAPPDTLWQDQAFNYQSTLVTETRDTLFALDPALAQILLTDVGAGRSTDRRLELLVARLYGPTGIRLSYTSGHTTGASETWRNLRGDCLSLTILAYASARFLGVNAHMQEVQVPLAFDRRGGYDFISGHVNVTVRSNSEIMLNGQSFGMGNFIIDFEPQVGSRRSGHWLTEQAILARFYNNRAAEYLVEKDYERAYAYYRAAIAAEPDYAPAFANLAQLYVRRGLLSGAEKLLAHAIALDGPSYGPLRSMRQLLVAQGRHAEAQSYATLLAKREDDDPYHWLGLGMAAMRDGQYRPAIRALERAAALTTGFEEVHYYLGLAYWRDGQWEAARKQLATLSAINNLDPGVATLSKKFSALAPQKSAVY